MVESSEKSNVPSSFLGTDAIWKRYPVAVSSSRNAPQTTSRYWIELPGLTTIRTRPFHSGPSMPHTTLPTCGRGLMSRSEVSWVIARSTFTRPTSSIKAIARMGGNTSPGL